MWYVCIKYQWWLENNRLKFRLILQGEYKLIHIQNVISQLIFEILENFFQLLTPLK